MPFLLQRTQSGAASCLKLAFSMFDELRLLLAGRSFPASPRESIPSILTHGIRRLLAWTLRTGFLHARSEGVSTAKVPYAIVDSHEGVS